MKKIAILAALAVVAGANATQLVYQNMVTASVASYRMAANATSSLEFGDQVALAGTDRRINQVRSILQLQGGGTGTFDFDLALRFRNLDGAASSPGTLIGPAYNFSFRGLANNGANAAAYVITLSSFLSDALPNNAAVMFQLTRIGGNQQGVGFQFTNDAAEIGASDSTFFWRENSAGSGTYGAFNFGATPSGNLTLELQAVPEPATMAVLGLGVAALLRRRNKKA